MAKFSSLLACLFLSLSSCVVFNENNHKKYILGTATDITAAEGGMGPTKNGEEEEEVNVITRKRNCLNYFFSLSYSFYNFVRSWGSANSYTFSSASLEREARGQSRLWSRAAQQVSFVALRKHSSPWDNTQNVSNKSHCSTSSVRES